MYRYIFTLLSGSGFPPVFALLLLLAFNALCILLLVSGFPPVVIGSKTKVRWYGDKLKYLPICAYSAYTLHCSFYALLMLCFVCSACSSLLALLFLFCLYVFITGFYPPYGSLSPFTPALVRYDYLM